jgi:hypothetical protein
VPANNGTLPQRQMDIRNLREQVNADQLTTLLACCDHRAKSSG